MTQQQAVVRRRIDLSSQDKAGSAEEFLVIRLQEDEGGAFEPATADALANGVIGSWGREAVALTGHTHAAKHIRHGSAGVYLNTGTWLPLVPMPGATDAASIGGWLDRLQRDEVPAWQGCPVARIDAADATLLHWDGHRLVDWASALPAQRAA